jgi:hypothetical protein
MADAHPKREFLEAAGALHPHPERVRALLFERYRFFDPLEKVQVKYEMLRAHAVEGQTVAAVSAAFGFSRIVLHRKTCMEQRSVNNYQQSLVFDKMSSILPRYCQIPNFSAAPARRIADGHKPHNPSIGLASRASAV